MKAAKATPTAFAKEIIANAVVMPFAIEELGSKNRASRGRNSSFWEYALGEIGLGSMHEKNGGWHNGPI